MRPVTSNNSHRHIGNCAIFYLKTTTTSLCTDIFTKAAYKVQNIQACHTLQLTFCGRQNTLLHLSKYHRQPSPFSCSGSGVSRGGGGFEGFISKRELQLS